MSEAKSWLGCAMFLLVVAVLTVVFILLPFNGKAIMLVVMGVLAVIGAGIAGSGSVRPW